MTSSAIYLDQNSCRFSIIFKLGNPSKVKRAKTLICQESNTQKDSGSTTTQSCKWPILGFDENNMLSKSLFFFGGGGGGDGEC